MNTEKCKETYSVAGVKTNSIQITTTPGGTPITLTDDGGKYEAASMTPADVPGDVNQAYELVKNLLFHQVHKFRSRYGGDVDELIGEAQEAFVYGHAEFVSGRTNGGAPIKDTYATSIRRWVWFSMFDKMRSGIAKRDATEAIGERDFELHKHEFNVTEWAEELGDDARAVVLLLLNPPRAISAPAERKGGAARNYRSTLREYLTDRGWAAGRVAAAFEEIKQALK